jgi:hypothetical protein
LIHRFERWDFMDSQTKRAIMLEAPFIAITALALAGH